jgi:hypothetical protein
MEDPRAGPDATGDPHPFPDHGVRCQRDLRWLRRRSSVVAGAPPTVDGRQGRAAMSSRMTGRRETTGVMPYWLPLGADGHSVRWNGRLFEAVVSSAQMADDDPVHRARSSIDQQDFRRSDCLDPTLTGDRRGCGSGGGRQQDEQGDWRRCRSIQPLEETTVAARAGGERSGGDIEERILGRSGRWLSGIGEVGTATVAGVRPCSRRCHVRMVRPCRRGSAGPSDAERRRATAAILGDLGFEAVNRYVRASRPDRGRLRIDDPGGVDGATHVNVYAERRSCAGVPESSYVHLFLMPASPRHSTPIQGRRSVRGRGCGPH